MKPNGDKHPEHCHSCEPGSAKAAFNVFAFREAVRNWSDRAKDRTMERRWTVIPATDHLERLLLPASVDAPWYRFFWSNLREFVTPERPPLDLTSKPVLVRDIWGQYGRRKRSWVMSVALQSAAVALMFTVASAPVLKKTLYLNVSLVEPPIAPYEMKPAHLPNKLSGGGGGGDGSALPASKGRLPKPALREFVPPQAVQANLSAILTMEPHILAPPEVTLPQINMANYGDPLGKVGPLSNGPGHSGGIGPGGHGGVGPGDGGGAGPGEEGGIDGGAYHAGSSGVTAPQLLYKKEPEYSEEARKAKYQGTVMLYVEITPDGRARNLRVLRSLGLGLDDKAIEAVRQWKFKPGMKDGKAVAVAASIEVNFRLL